MAEHAEQEVARSIHLRAEESHGLGQRLVDGLVESNEVLEIRWVGFAGIHPESQNAGPQRPVLGSKLVDVESAVGPKNGMGLRCGVGRPGENRRVAQ